MFFFFQAEDGIRDLVRSRGLGDVYKRQVYGGVHQQGALLGDDQQNPGAYRADASRLDRRSALRVGAYDVALNRRPLSHFAGSIAP